MQARYWLLTIPQHAFMPYLPKQVRYLRGQLERGNANQYLHWQLLVLFAQKVRLATVRRIFGEFHAEPSRSDAANEYVWKDDTAIEGTRFELGELPVNRNNNKDWERIWESAKRSRFDDIPADVRIRSYHAIKRIATDNLAPQPIERSVKCFWGPTGTGKSRRAWEEAGWEAYPKIPCTKFWDGYNGHEHVVIDEFTGQVAIEHLLRWFDRYPVNVETKGSAVVLRANRIWITSNVDPRAWYPTAPLAQLDALLRRLDITHFNENFF